MLTNRLEESITLWRIVIVLFLYDEEDSSPSSSISLGKSNTDDGPIHDPFSPKHWKYWRSFLTEVLQALKSQIFRRFPSLLFSSTRPVRPLPFIPPLQTQLDVQSFHFFLFIPLPFLVYWRGAWTLLSPQRHSQRKVGIISLLHWQTKEELLSFSRGCQHTISMCVCQYSQYTQLLTSLAPQYNAVPETDENFPEIRDRNEYLIWTDQKEQHYFEESRVKCDFTSPDPLLMVLIVIVSCYFLTCLLILIDYHLSRREEVKKTERLGSGKDAGNEVMEGDLPMMERWRSGKALKREGKDATSLRCKVGVSSLVNSIVSSL